VGAPNPGDKQIKIRYTDDKGVFDWVFQNSDSQDFDALTPIIDDTSPWKLSVQEEMSLVVIIMPVIFIMMALFAEIRCIQLIGGTLFHEWQAEGGTWHEFQIWHRSTEQMDLECAATFQFIIVAAFARLCSWFFNLDKLVGELDQRMVNTDSRVHQLKHFIENGGRASPEPDCVIERRESIMDRLEESSRDHKRALTFAGLQGISVYALVGALRSMLAIAIAFFLERGKTFTGIVHHLKTFMDNLRPIYVFTTFICVYNWVIVSGLPDLTKKEALGKYASLKFIAARVLLLVGDGQKGVLTFWVNHWDKLPEWVPEWARINENEADLLHVVLLMLIWCPGLVLWNLFFWTDRDKGNVLKFKEKPSFYNNKEPLLG